MCRWRFWIASRPTPSQPEGKGPGAAAGAAGAAQAAQAAEAAGAREAAQPRLERKTAQNNMKMKRGDSSEKRIVPVFPN
jgi:hypothetical protein